MHESSNGHATRGLATDPLLADDPPYLVFHQWLLIAAAVAIAVVTAVRSGSLAFVIENDSTYLSEAVLALFAGAMAYCGARSWRLSQELLAVQQAAGQRVAPRTLPPARRRDGWVSTFLARAADPRQCADPEQAQALRETLRERLRGPHEVGWFVTETLTKLGLLGTVIGFLIMMSALIGAQQLEIGAMQAILRDMASGMGVKIIATVVGLLCNMVLALQWLLLDRCADKVWAGAVWLAARRPGGATRGAW
jgi:biopolymer transport protein ExbB/TolQ